MKYSNKRSKISLDFEDMNASELVTFSNGTIEGLTGNADLPNPSIAISAISLQTGHVTLILSKIAAGDTSSVLTRSLSQKANILMNSLITNAHYVEDTANTIANGDLARAEQIILSSGYKLKQKAKKHQRAFEVVATFVGGFHARVNKAAQTQRESHSFRYGITSKKGIVPQNLITHHCAEADFILSGFESGIVVGIQHTNILPAKYGKTFLAAQQQIMKCITIMQVSEKGHPIFDHNTPDPYTWSDFIYVIIP